jgi:hypothetical protein
MILSKQTLFGNITVILHDFAYNHGLLTNILNFMVSLITSDVIFILSDEKLHTDT